MHIPEAVFFRVDVRLLGRTGISVCFSSCEGPGDGLVPSVSLLSRPEVRSYPVADIARLSFPCLRRFGGTDAGSGAGWVLTGTTLARLVRFLGGSSAGTEAGSGPGSGWGALRLREGGGGWL